MDKREVARIAAVWALIGLAFGCGDYNVFEDSSSSSSALSRVEKGVEALNEESWDEAIAIFEALDPADPEVRKYLASAYVGRAGFDTLELVDLMVTADEQGSDGSVLYDGVTSIFGDADGDGAISSADLAVKEADLALAVSVLAPGGQTSGEDDSETFQAAMYAGLQTIALIADLLQADDVSQGAISAMPDDEIDSRVTEERFGYFEAELEENLWLLVDGVDVVTENDVGKDLDRFITEIGFDDGDLSADDLRTFLKNF